MENKIDNRYIIKKEIGRGSSGCVYLIYDEKLKRNWAMKELKEYNKQEIDTLKTIDYVAFPRIVDLIETDTSHFLIMDYIEGITLKEYIQTCRVSEQSIKEIALQIAQALSYLHNLNPPIYYLDCKPDNILISAETKVKLIDLGSAYVDCNHNILQRISGTARYAPYEQKNPEINGNSISAQCDIYSFGITLFYAFTRSEQILRDRKEQLLVRNFNTTVSMGMNKIIDRCTKVNRKQRFHSMKEVIYALQNLEGITKKEKKKQLVYNLLRFLKKVFFSFVVLIFGISYRQTQNEMYLFFMGISLSYLYWILKQRKQTVFEIKKEIIRGTGKIIILLLIIVLLQNQMCTMAQNKEDKLNMLIKDSANRNILIKENCVWELEEDIKLVLPYEQLPEGKNILHVVCTNEEDKTQKSFYFAFRKDAD